MMNTMTGSPMLVQPYMPQNLQGKPGVDASPSMTFLVPQNMLTPQQAAMRNPVNISNQQNQMDNGNFAKDGKSDGNTLGVAPMQGNGNSNNNMQAQYSE